MGRKKTKTRKAQQTKQRKAAKQANRRKEYLRAKGRSQQGSASAEKRLAKLIVDFEDSYEYVFWIAHGLNCLASDYNEGTWTPVFPDLYDDGVEITEERIGNYLKKHYTEKGNTWTEEGRRGVGWAGSPATNVYAIQQKCIAEAEKNGVDPKKPACGPVWRVFGIMRDKIGEKMGVQYLATEPTVQP